MLVKLLIQYRRVRQATARKVEVLDGIFRRQMAGPEHLAGGPI
jgi:hypothetical protein